MKRKREKSTSNEDLPLFHFNYPFWRDKKGKNVVREKGEERTVCPVLCRAASTKKTAVEG